MLIQGLVDATANILTPEMLFFLFLGTFFGLVIGALPGLGGIVGMALALPFTFGMNPLAAMLIYAGIMSVTPLGGSLPAILLNTPGTGSNAASCLDGFPLTQEGQGTRVIAVSSTCCFIGTAFGIVVLFLLIPFVMKIILKFRSPEIFWLIIFGLSVISFVVRGDAVKGLASGGIGILISFIGYSDIFATTRYTGGSIYLWDGIPLVPFYLGLFALSSLLAYTSKGGTIAPVISEKKFPTKWRQTRQGILDVIKRPGLVLQSSMIGTLIGIIPGVGGVVASFISYGAAQRTSRHPETFGKGNIEGVIAAETANDSKEGGSLLPTVAFGIPGSAEMALLLGAFILHGLQPGPLLLQEHLDVVLTLSLGFTFSQLVGSVGVLFTAPYIARLVTIKIRILAPIVAVLCLTGAYAVRENIFDVFLVTVAGFFCYFLKRFGFPIIPIAIGYILGNLAETSFHLALMASLGSYKVFFSSPICLIEIGLIMVLFVSPYIKKIFKMYSK